MRRRALDQLLELVRRRHGGRVDGRLRSQRPAAEADERVRAKVSLEIAVARYAHHDTKNRWQRV